jgi:diguanylate cyclase (GGDEF)-like protein
VRAHITGILLIAAVVLLGVGWLLARSSLDTARDRGRHNAQFQAGLAAHAIADSLSQGQSVVAGLTGLDTRALLANPSACTLNFGGVGVFPSGHIDLVLPSGRVLCSSVAKNGAPAGASQAGASWLASPADSSSPIMSEPFTDGLTHQPAVAVVVPSAGLPGGPRLITALVLPLQPLARGIAATYGGTQHFAFTITDDSGHHVLSAPHVGDAPQVPTADASQWLQSSHAVPGSGWRVFAAEPTEHAVAPTLATLHREAWLGLAVLILLVVLLGWLNRRIAVPLARLSRSVRHAATQVAPEPLIPRGPTEARILADEFNDMMATRTGQDDQLRRHALHDPLTGVANRALLLDRIHRELTTGHASGRAEAVIAALDIDRFKAVNSNFGYRVGDAVLIETAQRIAQRLAPDDTLGRLGGDQFVVVRTGTSRRGSETLDRLLQDCFQEPFGPDRDIRVTASIGIVAADASFSAEDLLSAANLAMYAAKDAGGNRAMPFTRELGAEVSDRLSLEGDLRGALDRGELSLEFQPIVSLVNDGISGVEALLRWHHPTRGQVPPLAFIPVAEATRLILPIGRFVLHEACRQGARWHEQGHRLRISVNVSAHQLLDPDFPNTVAGILFETSFPADQLCLELTESTLMEDLGLAREVMSALKSIGVCLSIDDFGTGYSSLAYLRGFPVDEVKVDRAFVQDLAGDAADPALVAAMIAMAHALGLHVVAEGVEQQAQAQTLRTLGCRSAQGYLFCRPQTAEDLTQLLERRRLATSRSAARERRAER